MLTKRSHWVHIYIRHGRFRLPLVIPLRIIWECIDAAEDLLAFMGHTAAGRSGLRVLRGVSEAVLAIASMGRFDFVDVEKGEDMKIGIGLR